MLKNLQITTLDQFYQQAINFTGKELAALWPPDIQKEIGHFNVFDVAETIKQVKRKQMMPYNRRAYYKISLIVGNHRVEYADKVINVHTYTLLFATPKVPYHWIPLDEHTSGSFCIFTDAFLTKTKSGVALDELPIFKAGGYPVFEISEEEATEIGFIFRKMKREIVSSYEYKYDLLRNYVLELIHYGQKLQPAASTPANQNASARITALFVELLERQFPIESPTQQIELRSAREYAERLAIHVNYLNKALKEATGQTTTELISRRLLLEAKLLLKQTDWHVSDIAYTLGFEEVAHFSNFFKKQTTLTPLSFRA